MSELDTAPRLYLNSAVTAGPVITRYRRRAFTIWVTLAIIGFFPVILQAPPALRAAGLGLWFPGAGFLYSGYWWLAPVSVLVFVVSIAAWLIVGGFVFPVLTWVLPAVLAGLAVRSAPWNPAQLVVPVFSLGVVAFFIALSRYAKRPAALKKQAAIRDHLARVPLTEPELSTVVKGELTEDELGAMRYVLDRTLQPIDQFEGFVTIDQFREAAWRYQLVSCSYALAALQVNHLPAFRGYLGQAQRNAIVKMTDRRVWRYWRVENFLGNLKFSADPIRSENIMYSGWWALALGAFERATGDHRFSEPGALTLHDTRNRVYKYDYPAIVGSLVRQFDSPLCFFPCEPNWVFSACNLYGMTGLLLFDKAHGTRHGMDRLERFNDTLEREFTYSDGRFVTIASRRTGLVVSGWLPMNMQANAWTTNMVCPRQAQVSWSLLRRRYLEDTEGKLDAVEPPTADLLDPGNYRMTGAYYWATMMLAARELGDDELYTIATSRYDAMGVTVENGAHTRVGSVFANLTSHTARFGSKDTWYRFAHGNVPAATRTGPVLEDAPYPDVLVASANNDGMALNLVLRANHGSTRAPLSFSGLIPQRRYALRGVAGDPILVADHDGRAECQLDLAGRTALALTPLPVIGRPQRD